VKVQKDSFQGVKSRRVTGNILDFSRGKRGRGVLGFNSLLTEEEELDGSPPMRTGLGDPEGRLVRLDPLERTGAGEKNERLKQ